MQRLHSRNAIKTYKHCQLELNNAPRQPNIAKYSKMQNVHGVAGKGEAGLSCLL